MTVQHIILYTQNLKSEDFVEILINRRTFYDCLFMRSFKGEH